MTTELKRGDVIWLRTGLHAFHRQANHITVLKRSRVGVITSVRHHHDSTFFNVRILTDSGKYSPSGTLLTVAYCGELGEAFKLNKDKVILLRTMNLLPNQH